MKQYAQGDFTQTICQRTWANIYSRPVNNGTILVKENIGKNKKLKALSVRYKVKGYNPDAGDWFWVKYGTNGKVAKSGKPSGCIDCHSGADENDYIIVHSFD